MSINVLLSENKSLLIEIYLYIKYDEKGVVCSGQQTLISCLFSHFSSSFLLFWFPFITLKKDQNKSMHQMIAGQSWQIVGKLTMAFSNLISRYFSDEVVETKTEIQVECSTFIVQRDKNTTNTCCFISAKCVHKQLFSNKFTISFQIEIIWHTIYIILAAPSPKKEITNIPCYNKKKTCIVNVFFYCFIVTFIPFYKVQLPTSHKSNQQNWNHYTEMEHKAKMIFLIHVTCNISITLTKKHDSSYHGRSPW